MALPDPRARSVVRLVRAGAAGWVSLAAAVVATWPMAARIASAVPLGTEHEATVPLGSVWFLWWTADRIPHAFRGFLNAPYFFPTRGVTAYSEPMPLVGLLVSPLWAVGAPRALVYNVALLAVLTLNGVFGYRLASALGCPRGPALLCSAMTVCLPLSADLVGVLPNVALFGMLWTLDGFVRLARTGAARWAAWAAAGFVATFTTMQQYALFFAPAALAAAAAALGRRRLSRRARAAAAAVLVAGALALSVLALPAAGIRRASGGFERPERVVAQLSARPGDFLTRPATAALPFPRRDPSDTAGLFPGALLTALGAAGAVLGLREGRRLWTALLAGVVLYGFALSLGLRLAVGPWRPFATLRSVAPVFAEVRSPYRAAALVQVVLPVLAAVALARVGALRGRRGAALMVALGLLAAAENLSVPAPLVRVRDPDRTPWVSWIRGHPERRVLVHVPFPDGRTVTDYEIEARRLVAQTVHGRPIVNGYSSFFPVARDRRGRVFPAYAIFQLDMARDFPAYDLICVLGMSLRADTLVADGGWLAAHREQMATFDRFLRRVYAGRGTEIYALTIPRGECGAA